METRVSSVYEQGVRQAVGLTESDRALLMEEWLEFAADEGRNVHRLRELSHEYRSLTKATVATSLKRTHEAAETVDPAALAASAAYYSQWNPAAAAYYGYQSY